MSLPETLLPPNATPLERAFDRLVAQRLGAIETALRDFWSAERCPEAMLPWLAWALSVDQWDPAWPLRIRRARVAAAIAVHRRKGTLAAVRDAIASLGGLISVREWFQTDPPGEPHTFALTAALSGLAGDAPDAAFVDQVIEEVRATKPLRSHFTFTLALSALGSVGLVGALRAATYARVSGVVPAAGE